MASERGLRVAEVILGDYDGEGHFRSPESLRLYLVGSYLPGSLLHEETTPVAAAILEDLAGAGRFRDVSSLAAYVDQQMDHIGEQR